MPSNYKTDDQLIEKAEETVSPVQMNLFSYARRAFFVRKVE